MSLRSRYNVIISKNKYDFIKPAYKQARFGTKGGEQFSNWPESVAFDIWVKTGRELASRLEW